MGKSGRRDLRKESFWRRIIRGHGGSGMSIRAWCEEHGVSDVSFHWWRRELARRDAEHKGTARRRVKSGESNGRTSRNISGRAKPGTGERVGRDDSSSTFLPVMVTEDTHRNIPSLIEVVLGDGRSVRLAGSVDRESLAEVLDVLESRSC